MSLSAANGTPIEVLGCFEVQLRCQGFTGHGRCFMAKGVDQLLGIEWLDQLPPFAKAFNAICCQVEQKSVEVGSLSKELSDKYPEVFKKELGRCSMKKAEFRIKKGSCPIFCRPRKIPFTVEKAVDTELDRLVQAGVLKKVDYSHWAAPIVIVHKKNGTFRICADFKTGLNEALETHRHPLPTPEEIFSHLNQGAQGAVPVPETTLWSQVRTRHFSRGYGWHARRITRLCSVPGRHHRDWYNTGGAQPECPCPFQEDR